jgi:Lon-like ATP-dependent protease
MNYAREPGVRSLKKFINRIMEKVAYKLVASENPTAVHIDISRENIEEFLGAPIFESKRIYSDTPPGVVIGLAYNGYGGGILFIEATKASNPTPTESSKGTLRVTGSLGEVMKESSSIAQTYAKNFLFQYFRETNPQAVNFLEQQDIHIHFPEGAVPKDGPSAGVTIATSLIGLALGSSTIEGVGMTGEISLNGKVLKIGGVKEKTMAASREGLKRLIFPAANRKDVERLPEYIKNGIEFHFVDEYIELFKIVYPDFKL